MAIIDDYAAIAAAAARLRGERSDNDDPQLPAKPPSIGRDTLVFDDGRLRLFPRRAAIRIKEPGPQVAPMQRA